MPGSANLRVERKSEKDIKMRDLYLTIDDQPERTLKFGQEVEVPLEPGEHQLKITNRLYSDKASFNLKEGETVRFEGVNIQKEGLLKILSMVSGAILYRPVLKRLA